MKEEKETLILFPLAEGIYLQKSCKSVEPL